MKNPFFFGWFGNKRNEYKYIEKYIVDNNIKTIIEPYCGSCSVSYCISKQYPGKFKYILNDIDKDLYYLLTKTKDPLERNILNDTINEDIKKIKNKVDYLNLTGFNRWFIHRKYYNIRPGLYPENKTMKEINFNDIPIVDFLENENIDILNIDGVDLIEKYKDDESALIIIDPPYIDTCNDFYCNNTGLNVYQYFYMNALNSFKSKIILVLENIWVIDLLFKPYIRETFGKLYQPTKKKTEHIIITNYNIS